MRQRGGTGAQMTAETKSQKQLGISKRCLAHRQGSGQVTGGTDEAGRAL